MTINPNPKLYPFVLEPGFTQLINQLLSENDIEADDGVVLNFRDPSYSAETGGYHPVEICVDGAGVLQYVTDFAYFGRPPSWSSTSNLIGASRVATSASSTICTSSWSGRDCSSSGRPTSEPTTRWASMT